MQMEQQVCDLSNVSSNPSHLGQSNHHGLTFKVCLEEMAWHVTFEKLFSCPV